MPQSWVVSVDGQVARVQEYPSAWTVSIERAIEALEYFLQTGDRAPFVAWNDDGAG